ncbi:AI-2E family transporter [Methanoplanus endosymbiosus]|uniref:AI-2E family transporter n=1 Tax=Methanoplanus endosymbiosus TaxID=33865 RepID=A0A9E7TLA9_9EURY|nr:AI-2E family transporter [Methanoplanus endosymbiosus]UUX92131.1 AI-2E family transporter [Methanoplanus endosymbiosus]
MDLYHDRSASAVLIFSCIILISAIIAFSPVIDAFIFAATIAIVLMPGKEILCRRISERFASLVMALSVIFLFTGLTGILFLIIYGISDYAGEIFNGIILWFDNHDSIQSVPATNNILTDLLFGEDGIAGEIIDSMAGTAIISGIKLMLFSVLLYLFFLNGKTVWKGLKSIIPEKSLEIVNILEKKGKETLYAVYIVQFVTSVVTFALALPFFYLLGFDNVLELSVIAAIFQLIPVIGPSLMMAVFAFYSVSVGDYVGALLIAGIGYPVVCAFPDLVLRPVLMGRRALVHPAVMWIGFFGGIYVFGMSGLVLGPLLLALMMTAAKILVESEKIKKNRFIPEIFRRS